MNELMLRINEIEWVEYILKRDIDILARCYVSNTMDANLKLPSELDVSYNNLLERLVQKIKTNNKNTHINIINLMTYIDYYFNFT